MDSAKSAIVKRRTRTSIQMDSLGYSGDRVVHNPCYEVELVPVRVL